MSPEAIAVALYAIFLVAAALTLDRLGRHAHDRSSRFRTQGFTYHEHLDLWECPEGEHLKPVVVDHRRRVARYRASPAICNACPAKASCTDSDEGREVVRQLDPWPHSEAGRFHRGISLVVLALAGVVTLVEMARSPEPLTLALLGGVLLTVLVLLRQMAIAFLSTPSGFPGEEAVGHDGAIEPG
jgi:hypothetical protein